LPCAAHPKQKKPFVLDDVERRVLVLVERAPTGIFVGPFGGELNVPAYQIDQRDPAG
jgi:hypothetical protein